MRVLVACESSAVIASRFYALHPETYSVDLKPTEHPTFPNHIQDDALHIAYSHHWDLIIAHPPCQFLANSGFHHNKNNPYRQHQTNLALKFALALWNAPAHRIVLEQPRSHLATILGPSHYTYHPWYFGEPYSKFTCLWLKNLKPPKQTHFAPPKVFLNRDPDTGYDTTPADQHRATTRARTLPGVAAAFVRAWA